MSFYYQNRLRRRHQAELGIELDSPHIEACIHCNYIGVDDALLVAGLAATVAGTGASIAGNEAAQHQMEAVRTAERKRQDEVQNQANNVFKKSLSTQGADTAQNTVAKGAAQRQSVYNALKQVAQPVAGSPLPEDQESNPVVNTDGATPTANRLSTTRNNAWTALTSQAASREGGYQDYANSQELNNAEANRRLGVLNNQARGWAGIMPTEMQVASHAGDALAGWGQLVSALGSTAGMAGAARLGTTNPNTVNITDGQAPGGGPLWGNIETGDV